MLSLLTAAPAAYAQRKKDKKTPTSQSQQSGQKGLNFTAVAAEPVAHTGFYAHSYAIIIGISHYRDPSINLEYAAADAKALKEILVRSYDFPEENVTVLIDQEATKAAIENALSSIKDKKKFTDRTRVIVYFSGHGQTIKDKLGLDKGFLIPYDEGIDLKHPEDESAYMKTCIRMDTLWGYLTNTTVNLHALLIADACYGGLLVNVPRDLPTGEVSSNRPSDVVIGKELSQNALEAMTAGGAGQPVIENSAWGHGAFTYELLKELSDKAKKTNMVFPANELAADLKRSVQERTKAQQTPLFGQRDSEGDVLFYTSDAKFPDKSNKVAPVAPHHTNNLSEPDDRAKVGATDFSELAGQKLTVQPEERLSTNDVQQGAEVRFLVKDDLKDSKGKIIIPAKTLVVGHVSSRNKVVNGGDIKKSILHYGQDSKLGVSCDYILTPHKKIPLQKNEYSIGGSMGSGIFRMDGKRDRVMKPENTFINLKIVENLNSAGDEPLSTNDE